MGRPALVVAAAAVVGVLAAAPARAGISGTPHEAKLGEARVIDVDFVNQANVRAGTLFTRIPASATLVAATASDPAWTGSALGRDIDWRGGALEPGAHVHIRLELRFAEAGTAALVARINYVDGSYEQAPILVDVHGTASRTDVVLVLVGGGAILFGAVVTFVVGRRASRG